jgi:MSHA biogenesis protein MshM
MFFGLTEAPFGLTPNTRFFCALPTHQEALSVLRIALDSGEGFIKITGEVGTGKTLLCRRLLNELGERYATAYFPSPILPPQELLQTLAEAVGVDSSPGQGGLLKRIFQQVANLARSGRRLVLVLDEAQAMPPESLEILRLLSNFETEKEKLLQIVLFGQPELDELLGRPRLRQLLQRIGFSYRLRPLDRQETQRYLFSRLRVAGYAERDLFSLPAYWLLHYASRGVPRLINILAHKALLIAYSKNERSIKAAAVWRAIADSEGVQGRPGSLALLAMASLAVWAGSWLYWGAPY